MEHFTQNPFQSTKIQFDGIFIQGLFVGLDLHVTKAFKGYFFCYMKDNSNGFLHFMHKFSSYLRQFESFDFIQTVQFFWYPGWHFIQSPPNESYYKQNEFMARTHYLVSVLKAYPKSQISQVLVIKEYLQLSIKIH